MPYQTLYRAFRPQSLEEVCGQQTVTRVLSRQLETGRISHAYLFCGSRGTGKTSTAKAFARVLSCLHPEGSRACGACEACRQSNNMDIVEIDAASNNGVDEIRDLRERVKYPPVNGRYKVYIIDEVHMLSTAAFNALLKTLEEPPEHVVFILATTEPRRLPATILSRCQRYDFRRISAQVIVARMREILAQIGASAEDEALELIAQSAEGGMRDALSLLDMCLSYAEGALTAQAVRDVTGSAGRSFLFEYTQALANMDAAAALQLIDRLVRDGRDLASFASEEGDHLRALLLAKFAPEAVAELLEVSEETAQRYREQSAPIGENRLVQLTELFLEAQSRMKYLSSARAALELCTVRACRPAEGVDMESVLARLEALEAMPRAAAPRAEESPKKAEPRAAKAAPRATEAARPSAPATAPEPAPEEYGRALEALVAAKPMLRPQLSAMKFERREGNCIFTTFAKSAAMQMTLLERFRPQIEEALAEAFGEPMSLRMRREDERPKGLDRPVRQIITQAQDLFGMENVELGDE